MGCGINGKQNLAHSLPGQRIEPQPIPRLIRFKLPAEVLFGFEKVLKVEVRKTDKRVLPAALVGAESTQQDPGPVHLAALRSNAGIVKAPEKRGFSDGLQFDSLHTEEDFQPISPEPPVQMSDEDSENWREDPPVLA